MHLCGDEHPAAQRKCKWETGRVPEPGTVSRTEGGLKVRHCGHSFRKIKRKKIGDPQKISIRCGFEVGFFGLK